jgi:hypothetical protein
MSGDAPSVTDASLRAPAAVARSAGATQILNEAARRLLALGRPGLADALAARA